jgi:hypothetical protein
MLPASKRMTIGGKVPGGIRGLARLELEGKTAPLGMVANVAQNIIRPRSGE